MRHAMFGAMAIAAALMQVVLVDGLPLAGGEVPDIALVLVVVLGLTKGPVTGMLTGFCAGLCLDLAPPGGYVIGGSAFVFCLIGYGCGRISDRPGGSAPRLLAAAVIAVCGGEVAQAGLGLVAGDSGVNVAAVLHGLPVTLLYDVIVCSVLLAAGLAAGRSRASRAGLSNPASSRQVPLSGPSFSGPSFSGPSFSGPPSSHPAGRVSGGRMARPTRIAGNGAVGGIEPSRSLRHGHGPDGASGSGPRPDLGYSAMRVHPRLDSKPVRLRLRAAGGGLRRQAGRPAGTKFRPNRAARVKYHPVRLATRQNAAGSLRLGVLPRSVFGGRPRRWRELLHWTGARSARRGGMGGPGGLR
jgi:rod shape-determining protein MreD